MNLQENSVKRIAWVAGGATVLFVILFCIGWRGSDKQAPSTATDFISCAAAGNPVMESYPRQCRTSDGRNFLEEIKGDDHSDLIIVDSPESGVTVKSPIRITGKARGHWFFEASFPIELRVAAIVVGHGIAQAQGEWMTTGFVPFEATLEFLYTFGGDSMPAELILKKDNPSGLPEHDDRISIPVVLMPGVAKPTDTCKPTGCSGQICSDKEVITTCEYRAEHACYRTATCERQAGGKCGWTSTQALIQCLENAPPSLE